MNAFYKPGLMLRLEGLAVLAAGCVLYQRFHAGHWGQFALLFLAPDVSLLAYVGGARRFSSAVYNAFHNYLIPVALAAIAPKIALIWICHIGFDRLAGYGLKYEDSFRSTHIQAAARVI